jgi:hypothetical protein
MHAWDLIIEIQGSVVHKKGLKWNEMNMQNIN